MKSLAAFLKRLLLLMTAAEECIARWCLSFCSCIFHICTPTWVHTTMNGGVAQNLQIPQEGVPNFHLYPLSLPGSDTFTSN